ncbi:hypothetical protein EVY02_16110, partial [Enterobacter hormaechei]
MDSLEKKESPESAGPEITKKMVRERTTKKITFEIDIEKILKYLFFFAFAVLVIMTSFLIRIVTGIGSDLEER